MGALSPLDAVEQLARLPSSLYSDELQEAFEGYVPAALAKQRRRRDSKNSKSKKKTKKIGFDALFSVILSFSLNTLLSTAVLKLILLALSFAGPLLLGAITHYLENLDGKDVTNTDLYRGLVLVGILSGTAILSSLLSTNYNIRLALLKIRLNGALSRIVFYRSITFSLAQQAELQLNMGEINNFLQIDVGNVAGAFNGIHELWSLPISLIICFALLYIQIKLAFLAGVIVIVLMIPVNSYIAKRIGTSTTRLMLEKDKRVQIVNESLWSIASLKMTGLDAMAHRLSSLHRHKELRFLAQRKYLDAVCVLLWTFLPVLVPFVTFLTSTVVLEQQLSSAEIISTIALLQMLIFPMNGKHYSYTRYTHAIYSITYIPHVYPI